MEIRQGGRLHGTHVQVIADSAVMCHHAIRRTLWLLRAGFAPRGVNLSRFWHAALITRHDNKAQVSDLGLQYGGGDESRTRALGLGSCRSGRCSKNATGRV